MRIHGDAGSSQPDDHNDGLKDMMTLFLHSANIRLFIDQYQVYRYLPNDARWSKQVHHMQQGRA